MEMLGRDELNRFGTTLLAASIAFMYATVLLKLGNDWWTDENYSHGVLIPFVIGAIIWKERNTLKAAPCRPMPALGMSRFPIASIAMLWIP